MGILLRHGTRQIQQIHNEHQSDKVAQMSFLVFLQQLYQSADILFPIAYLKDLHS